MARAKREGRMYVSMGHCRGDHTTPPMGLLAMELWLPLSDLPVRERVGAVGVLSCNSPDDLLYTIGKGERRWLGLTRALSCLRPLAEGYGCGRRGTAGEVRYYKMYYR